MPMTQLSDKYMLGTQCCGEKYPLINAGYASTSESRLNLNTVVIKRVDFC